MDIDAEVFGRGNDLPSLMLGYVIQVQNCAPILRQNRFTANMKTKKKRKNAERILQIEKVTFTPLIFTTTGGISPECNGPQQTGRNNCHQKIRGVFKNNELAEGEISLSLIRSALVCLRGSRCLG